MPQVYCAKILVTALTFGLKLVTPVIAILVAAHFNPGQIGALTVHPLNWGKNP